MAGPHVIDVDEAQFAERVLEASRTTPVVVDFWAGWCQPCLFLSPVLERLAEEHAGRFVLAKVDVDANPTLAARYRVQGIPAVKAFRDGEVVSEFVGAQPEDVVRRFLDSVLPSAADQRAASGREAHSPEEAEAAYREALALDPSHPDAAAGLAALLIDRGDLDESRSVLAAATPTAEIRRVQAELDLRRRASSDGDLGEAARSAVAGDHRSALERLLAAMSDGGDRDSARSLMLQLFEVLGDDHPLTREFRGKLASVLF
ncbi:MAG TPA: tetratricopeptide repeat protein [Actinomycetota bacterium]|nr:tetratricopeptide repeat protein [Actinomycetota bacterium]